MKPMNPAVIASSIFTAYALGVATATAFVASRPAPAPRASLIAKCIPPAPAQQPRAVRMSVPLRYDATIRQMERDGYVRTRYYSRPENRR